MTGERVAGEQMATSTGSGQALRHDIDADLDVALDVKGFDDYGPNGLQVEGRAHVRRLVSGVTASLDIANPA